MLVSHEQMVRLCQAQRLVGRWEMSVCKKQLKLWEDNRVEGAHTSGTLLSCHFQHKKLIQKVHQSLIILKNTDASMSCLILPHFPVGCGAGTIVEH